MLNKGDAPVLILKVAKRIKYKKKKTVDFDSDSDSDSDVEYKYDTSCKIHSELSRHSSWT